MPTLLLLAHLLGLVLAAGAATAKLTLLIRSRADGALVAAYISVAGPLTRLILVGLVLLTVSGVTWVLTGYPVTSVLVVKIALVTAIWGVGPIIDKVAEPRFRKLAPGRGEPASPEFLRVRRWYLALETTATGLFYSVVVLWVLQGGR